jgi:protein-tyrosine phosphatase
VIPAEPNAPPEFDRHLRLAGTRNLRDVGGYPAGVGRVTRWRTLFRSDALDQLPPVSRTGLADVGLRLAIDLRWPAELSLAPSVFAESTHVRYVNVPLLDNAPSPPGGVLAVYLRILDERGGQLAEVVRAIMAPDALPAVVGCAAGVDRTGMTIALILSAIGVPSEIIATDYALSAASFAEDGLDFGLSDWRSGAVEIDCLPEYMMDALDHLRRRHGGAAGLLARHGLEATEIDRLHDLLTEPLAGP